ncbi:hypothetical protein Fmac_032623 [Flemingia macrophylla]|uniref:Uncharacterized protein n=1 Tax=Flemingia macrophylla TaxID=520843 RepID=A0ABD1L5H1_9FABA
MLRPPDVYLHAPPRDAHLPPGCTSFPPPPPRATSAPNVYLLFASRWDPRASALHPHRVSLLLLLPGFSLLLLLPLGFFSLLEVVDLSLIFPGTPITSKSEGTQQHRHISFVFVFVSGQPCSDDLRPPVQKKLSEDGCVQLASTKFHYLFWGSEDGCVRGMPLIFEINQSRVKQYLDHNSDNVEMADGGHNMALLKPVGGIGCGELDKSPCAVILIHEDCSNFGQKTSRPVTSLHYKLRIFY